VYRLNDNDLAKVPCERMPNTHRYAQTNFMKMYKESDLQIAKEEKDELKVMEATEKEARKIAIKMQGKMKREIGKAEKKLEKDRLKEEQKQARAIERELQRETNKILKSSNKK
jgi:hypothetical protein